MASAIMEMHFSSVISPHLRTNHVPGYERAQEEQSQQQQTMGRTYVLPG
jgi:hypothetical protein